MTGRCSLSLWEPVNRLEATSLSVYLTFIQCWSHHKPWLHTIDEETIKHLSECQVEDSLYSFDREKQKESVIFLLRTSISIFCSLILFFRSFTSFSKFCCFSSISCILSSLLSLSLALFFNILSIFVLIAILSSEIYIISVPLFRFWRVVLSLWWYISWRSQGDLCVFFLSAHFAALDFLIFKPSVAVL